MFNKTILVTGANGYIASEIIQQLLSRGYKVRGTVRSLDEDKVGHLRKLVNSRNLELLVVESLTKDGVFDEAVKNVDVVIHTASPLSGGDKEDDFVVPAVKGTTEILDAISRNQGSVKCVVVTSSIAAISTNGGLLPATHVYTENDWSDEVRMRERKGYYQLSKTLAERAAWNHQLVRSGGVKLVTICPGFVIGPILNASHARGTPNKWLQCLSGVWGTVPNKGTVPVDVRDVAKAHLRAFEDPDAEGRYAVVYPQRVVTNMDVVESLQRAGAKLNIPLEEAPFQQMIDIWDVRKAEKLIGGFHSLEETTRDMLDSFNKFGLVKKH